MTVYDLHAEDLRIIFPYGPAVSTYGGVLGPLLERIRKRKECDNNVVIVLEDNW